MQASSFLKKLLLNVMATAAALLLGDYLMDNVAFSKNWVALVAAVVLALLNTVLRPLLVLLTIPATLFTLGLFLLFINTVMLMIADQLVDGFVIHTFWSAFLLSLVIAFFNALIGGNIRVERHRVEE
ncbi:MAG: phage holin family protein [Flavobacteriales bacterium]